MVDGPNWAALAIPVFLVLTLVEAWIARRSNRSDVFTFGTAVADLSCGSVFLAGEILLKIVTLGAYSWLFQHRWIDWSHSSSMWPWLIAIIGVDFLFYWWHRASHVVNTLWAVHGVHHQSEDYNLAVALRQPLFEPITWFLFYAILALLGVSPLIYLGAYAINRLYQFFIHTQLVDRLGPLEWVFNTPSHHRVHHGVQPQYLDRNYGAILIVWDRWFGTFEPECEPPQFGTTIPLRSYNPLWANFEHFARIWRMAALAPRRRDRLWAPWAHPAWLPQGVQEFAKKPTHRTKYRVSAPPVYIAYVSLQFGLAGVFLGIISFYEHAIPLVPLAACVGVLVASFVALNALLEHRPWALRLEAIRLLAMVICVGWLTRHLFHVDGARWIAVLTLTTVALALPFLGARASNA